jgi:hypothetical protein
MLAVRGALLVAAILLGTGVAGAASAYTIEVARPDGADHVLVESFSRLCGELRMYGLQVGILEAGEPSRFSDRQAGEGTGGSDVVGGVALARTPGQASARIWIAAKDTGKESVRITVSVDDADAPSLLAIRAADLLRASLRDFHGAQLPEPAPPPKASEVVDARAAAEPTHFEPARWSVTAGAVALVELGRLGTGWAPSIEVQRRMSDRWALGVSLIAPVYGQSYAADGASAGLRQELVTASAALRLVGQGRLTVDVVQGLGVGHFSVHGTASSPWVGQDSSAWAAVSSTGAAAGLRLSKHLALDLGLAAIFLVPRPVVDVGRDSHVVRQPLLSANAGLSLLF